jgi:hypothetical protein
MKRTYITKRFVLEYIKLRINIYDTINDFIKEVNDCLTELSQYPALCKYQIRFYTKVKETLNQYQY